jgi:hypothetical protein
VRSAHGRNSIFLAPIIYAKNDTTIQGQGIEQDFHAFLVAMEPGGSDCNPGVFFSFLLGLANSVSDVGGWLGAYR